MAPANINESVQPMGRPVLSSIPSRANQQIIPQNPAGAGTKRKATEAPPNQNVDLDSINVAGMPMDANCDQVRRKIRRFIDSGEMNVGQFADTIGVSKKSLNGFLGQNGAMKGAGSATYDEAWGLFKKREIAGLKMPTVKKAKTAAAANGNVKATAPPLDLSGILISGEASDSVPVYDSCDEIRKKINAHLAKPGVTQAQFCRDLAAQLHLSERKISSNQLTVFRNKKGPWAGNTSIVFVSSLEHAQGCMLTD